MPEGDTVWRTADFLHRALADEVLTHSDLRVPRLALVDLSGRRVQEVRSRGKHLLTRVEGGLTLHSHLGMDGAWYTYPTGGRRPGGPGHQLRAVLVSRRSTAVGYRLPLLRLVRTAEEGASVGPMGPDLLGSDWHPGQALRRLLAAPDRPVSEALTDQRNLAGIGNVYASELCFLVGVTPWTPIGRLSAPERLPQLAHRLLDANKSRVGRSTTGELRRDRALYVYGREHLPCRRCGTAVRRGRHGPPDRPRVVYHCPGCQRGPSAPPPGS